jgi:hypothetical protein
MPETRTYYEHNLPDGDAPQRTRPPRKLKPLIEQINMSGPESIDAPDDDHSVDADYSAYKYWNWGDIRVNDCTMHNAGLIIFDDGTGRFYSEVRTSDADDVWIIRALSFVDNHGIELYRSPKYDGPNMVIDNYVYIFTVDPLYFPAHLFASIASVNMTSHC